MAKRIHLFLTPRQADIVHWSLLLAQLDLEDFDRRTGQPAIVPAPDLSALIHKVVQAKLGRGAASRV